MHYEFSEQQQAFHLNYGNTKQDSNGYKTIFSGTQEEIDAIEPKINRAKEIRDKGHLTFERAKEIINP